MSSPPGCNGHPIALWLYRVGDHLDEIFVRHLDEATGRWGNRSLAELPIEEAAGRVADFLLRWPFIPLRVTGGKLTTEAGERADTDDVDGLTLEQLKEALAEGRALVEHFQEIRERVLEALAERRKSPNSAGTAPRDHGQLLVDAAALVGYLQLVLDDNERFVAFLLGLEEAGTITRAELELLMGLRKQQGASPPATSYRRLWIGR